MKQTENGTVEQPVGTGEVAGNFLESRDPVAILGLLTGLIGNAMRRTLIVCFIGLIAVGILVTLSAKYTAGSPHAVWRATLVVALGGAICALATIIYAVASSVLCAAAEGVRRGRLAQLIVERVFDSAVNAMPSLVEHDVTRGFSTDDHAALNDAILRTRASVCGRGGIRALLTGWLFDAIASRMLRFIAIFLGDRANSGQTIRFGGVPALAARLVNEAVATMLESAATRLLVLWIVIVLLLVGLINATRML